MTIEHFPEYELPRGREPYCHLTNQQLNDMFRIAEAVLHESVDTVKAVQDERFRRYRIVHMMAEHGDWPGGTLKELQIQPPYPDTY